jgi:hypothetical protein
MPSDPKTMRRVPQSYTDANASPMSRPMPVAWRFEALALALERIRPAALGMMLPFSYEMHFYAYREASDRGIYTAIAMPTNPGALSGLMRSVPIEMVLVNDAGARALERDLREQGMLSAVRLWFVVSPEGEPSDFALESGEVIHATLP